MFRFLHTADLHLDSPLQGLASREGAPVDELRGASRRAFDNLVELAVDEAVDFVVIAGDVYDRDWKDYHTGLFFRARMVRLKDAEIPVYLISGNHDAASVISRKLSLPENVKVFSSRAPETVDLENLPVAIHGMSFPNRAVDENLVLRYPEAEDGKFNIGLLHTSLAGAEGHDTYAPCSVADLVGKGYAYWALGHVHQPSVIREDPWIVYSGNIQGRHIRECGERGCRIVNVNDDLSVSECTWYPLDVVRWRLVEVDVSGVEAFGDLVDRIRNELGAVVAEAAGRLSAVRVMIRGTTPLHGQLCSRPDRLEAEVEACAQEFGGGAVWIEQVKISTQAVVSLEELAARDALTKVVIDGLHEAVAPDFELPSEISAMLQVLQPDLREPILQEWNGASRQSMLDDSCAMILDRLTTRGGDA